MPVYKTTWFFESVQQSGNRTASSVCAWTETWYQTPPSVDAALFTAIQSGVGTWIGLRLNFLHSQYYLKWVRVSRVDNPRETKVGAVPGGPFGQVGVMAPRIPLPGIATGPAQVNCCVLADVVVLPSATPGDKTHHRRILLRGLGQEMINGNVVNTNAPSFQALVRFLNYVASGESPNFPKPVAIPTWLIRIQNPTVGYLPLNPVAGLAVDPANPQRIVVNAALGNLLQGARVQIKGVTTPRGVNKIWTTIAPYAAPPYTLAKSRFALAGAWTNNGFAQVVSPIFVAANQYTIIGLRDRHTGSQVFGRTRGRRRVAS